MLQLQTSQMTTSFEHLHVSARTPCLEFMVGSTNTPGTTMHLLSLPRELRDQIWSLVFRNTTVTPFARQSQDWFFYPARRQCHACPGTDSSDVPSTKQVFRWLLACKQLYQEAYPIFHRSICLHVAKPGELEDIRQSSHKALRSNLRFLKVVVHLTDASREQWKHELCNLANTFPGLERLDISNHMRPPVSFQNLSDAIYLVAPIVHFPPRMTPRLRFAYIEDDEMFSSEELGTIYYRDALEAHESVIRALMADSQFKEHSRNFNMEPMINRLMRIAQSYEEPWLESIRRKRRQESSSAPT